MKLSLPYIDQPADFWKKMIQNFGQSVYEIYFPLKPEIGLSGRPVQKTQYLNDFLEQIEIPQNVLINPVILHQPVETIQDRILEELTRLHNDFGVSEATVSNLSLARYIKTRLPSYTINASVLMSIHDPEQIIYLNSCIDTIVVDTSLVRNLKKLALIKNSFSGQIKLIVNEGCLPGCPYRVQHFYEMTTSLPYPKSLCQTLIDENPWLSLKSSWILPQHLDFYKGLYDIIKLAGRITLQNPEKYFQVVNAYVNRTPLSPHQIGCGPGGLRVNIPISDDFFYHTITCDKNCAHCDYCKNYYEKYI